MTEYLDLEDVLHIAEVAFGGPVQVRDIGLLDSAVHRPSSGMFGQEAYGDLFDKASALMQSLTFNHPFVDGKKRTAWIAAVVFLGLNGVTLPLDVDGAEALVVEVAKGSIEDVRDISARLRALK
ncbi:type II toxin-antitoxin system death-on-curing family toxin [Nocardia iowensis]|uniref:Type II toxin-antitoxin system death-on-curing family toxin n=1 Tax=Nocardia iowensis TaxID=204891 RepID=A0ABX8RT57_NOCIO|nr:type II toxin-antitoxin system death-on-curing family toxin [Nocardia iowensis]QXN92456.1 type II toxin-antitoxin system death-on-curing family toxin [Nocardia iowensis]